MNKKKNLLLVGFIGVILFGFSLVGILRPSTSYSLSERRALAQRPKASTSALSSGKFMSQFEDYAMDQFPMRERFRTLKAVTALNVFQRKDNHGIYSVDGWVSSLEYPLNSSLLEYGAKKLQSVYDRYLSGTDCKAYLSIIPDKNAFLAPLGGYPSMDYDSFVEQFREKAGYAQYIDIFPLLSLEDYYHTDQHWRQESILDIADTLAEGMGAVCSDEYTEKTLDIPFYGSYVGQSALSFDADTIHYLTSDILENCIVTSYDTGSPVSSTVYNMKKANGKEPYDLFLSGANPLVIIENPNAASDKELVLFRDSFGSSLAPLLVSGYSKVTLVDLRYLKSSVIGNYIKFDHQDILFLYSTLILNNSMALQ